MADRDLLTNSADVERNKGGRPPINGEGATKRQAISMRVTPVLRERIQRAAEASGLSMAQEVERRLIASFDYADATDYIRRHMAPVSGTHEKLSRVATVSNREIDRDLRTPDLWDKKLKAIGVKGYTGQLAAAAHNLGLRNLLELNALTDSELLRLPVCGRKTVTSFRNAMAFLEDGKERV